VEIILVAVDDRRTTVIDQFDFEGCGEQMTVGALTIWMAGTWLFVGAIVAVVFLTIGIGRVEEHARGAYAFRPLLVPGILLLWPIVLWRWFEIERPANTDIRRDVPLRDAHAGVWFVLAVLMPIILFASLAVRQQTPAPQDAAVRIDDQKQ
jgi:hypothetical protein